MSGKIYCDSCGLEIENGYNYCPHCGDILNENLNGDESVQLLSPCVRDGDKDLNECTDKEWFLKIFEEIFEALEARTLENKSPDLHQEAFAAKMMDVITVCRSYLHARGYDGTKLKNLDIQVDDSNNECGRLN